MNFTQVLVSALVSLIVAAFGALVAGIFGIRYGLQQAKRERAFDRGLEWREKVIRAMTRFSDSAWELRHELVLTKDSGRVSKCLPILEERTIELEHVLEESVLFADRKTVIQLREILSFLTDELQLRLEDVRREPDPDKCDIETISDFAIACAKDFRKLAFTLSQNTRRELELEEIELDDLKTENEKAMEKDQKASRPSPSQSNVQPETLARGVAIDKISSVHRPTEGMRRLAIVVGVAAAIWWIVFSIVETTQFTRINAVGWLTFWIGLPISFSIGFLLIWAVDWVIAGFRKGR